MKKMFQIFSLLMAYFSIGVTNASASFSADVENFIAEKVLPIAQRNLIAYQFGQPLRLDKHRGTTYTATRFERVNLPYAQLSEGVAPVGEAMTISQVSATAQQWGDRIILTDVADLTIKHPVFKQAIRLTAIQEAETLERNTFNTLMTGAQINYVNGRANRAALIATDVMSPHEANRVVGSFETYGVPLYDGSEREDLREDAGAYKNASKSPAMTQHYVALIHPLCAQDMAENALVANAWATSDINRLYNNELGEWRGVRYCKSNMIPYWVGVAQVNGSAGTVGSLADGTYYVQVTAAPAQTSVEQRIYQVSTAVTIAGAGGAGSISVTLPTLANYVFNVYIGTTTSPANLGLSASGPTSGPLAGQATQLASGSTVIITGIGTAQTPPAAPATGVTVFPTFFLGEGSYGQVLLEDVEYFYLTGPDKSDPLNQTRVVGWKVFYGSIILNQAFMARVESSSQFSTGYNAGTQA